MGKKKVYSAVSSLDTTDVLSVVRVGVDSPREITWSNFQNAFSSVTWGTLSSSVDTSGVALSSSKTAVLKINADTGGVALTTGTNARAACFRFLVGTAITSGNISTYGAECLNKTIVSVNTTGNSAGVCGHFETQGTLTLTGSKNTSRSGVASFVDLAADTTVAAGTVISAFGVNAANFGDTNNGRHSIMHVSNPASGTWTAFLDLSDNTGLTQDTEAGSGAYKYLKVYLNGVLYTIAMRTA